MRIEVPQRLLGDGVVLRPMTQQDAAAYARAFQEDRDLGSLLGIEEDPGEQQVRERIETQAERAEAGRGIELTVADPADDGFLGSVVLHSVEPVHRRAEVGFWLRPGARGRGLGAAAVAVAVSWAFRELDLLRVEMTTTPDNPAVPALARRVGFVHEGILRARNIERGRRVDILWFGLLREEWSED